MTLPYLRFNYMHIHIMSYYVIFHDMTWPAFSDMAQKYNTNCQNTNCTIYYCYNPSEIHFHYIKSMVGRYKNEKNFGKLTSLEQLNLEIPHL